MVASSLGRNIEHIKPFGNQVAIAARGTPSVAHAVLLECVGSRTVEALIVP